MKVLHIASGDLWAGAEKQLYTLLVALKKSNQVEVMAAILNPGKLAEQLQLAGVTTLVLNENDQNALQIARQLGRFIARNAPNLIHTHRLKENIIGGLLAVRYRIPSVRTQHGSNEHGFSALNIRKRVLYDASYLVGRFLQKQIIAVSEPLANELRTQFGDSRVCVIHNGINLQEDQAKPSKGFNDPLKIGIVGRLVPVKRVDLFLQIAQDFSQHYERPEPPEFHIIGDGPLRTELEDLASTLGLGNHIIFHGHTDNAEQQIAALDVLVLCSDHEGLPMVALEAMKQSTLVLTHAIGGLPQLLDKGKFGVLVERQSVADFVTAINNIIQDKETFTLRAKQAYQQLKHNYSAESMAQSHTELYKKLTVAD